MKRQLQGIAILLCCILLILGFERVGWRFVFDLDLRWTHLFMLGGAAGLLLCFLPEKKS